MKNNKICKAKKRPEPEGSWPLKKRYQYITIVRKRLWQSPKCEKNTIKLIEAISLYREGAHPPAFVDNLEVGAWIDIKRVILPMVYVRAHMVIEKEIHIVPFSVQKKSKYIQVGKVGLYFTKEQGQQSCFNFEGTCHTICRTMKSLPLEKTQGATTKFILQFKQKE